MTKASLQQPREAVNDAQNKRKYGKFGQPGIELPSRLTHKSIYMKREKRSESHKQPPVPTRTTNSAICRKSRKGARHKQRMINLGIALAEHYGHGAARCAVGFHIAYIIDVEHSHGEQSAP